MPEMPEIPNPTIETLTTLLYSGLIDTLTTANTSKVLTAPYGRPAQVTVQDIEDKVNNESSDDDDDDEEEEEEGESSEEEVEFSYEYGFVSAARWSAKHMREA